MGASYASCEEKQSVPEGLSMGASYVSCEEKQGVHIQRGWVWEPPM